MRAPRYPQETGRKRCYLYAIQIGDYVKVGLSRDMNRRLAEINAHNPYEPVVRMKRVVSWNVAPAIEKHVHERLAPWHHRREWFSAPIEEVLAAAEEAIELGRALHKQDYLLP